LLAAFGLLGLAYTGQFVVPALRPVAVAGVALYGLPNVVNGAKQLTRGQIGLSAMYSVGLGFMLVGGMPFTASVMASFMQAWPQLAQRKLVRAQRRLFAAQRSRPAWARLESAAGTELEVSVEQLRAKDRVVVRSGELVPVDGVVVEGTAVLVHAAPLGRRFVEDRAPGDGVVAGAFVRSGALTVRVERVGADTIASYVDSLLPHGALAGLPSSLDAERIANRNAKPALALSLLTVWLTRTPLPGQAVLRPDYATGPRLSAQLSALQAVAQGLQQGVLFKNLAAIDRARAADFYVIDDSVGIEPPARGGAPVSGRVGIGRQVVAALRAQQRKARIVYVSQRPEAEARAVARVLGIDAYHGGLSPQQKADLIRGLGGRTLWIGDGSSEGAPAVIAASSVSLSVAPLARARQDAADVLLTQYGLALVPEVLELVDAHARRLRRDYRTLYTLNLLGVAGAFLARFNTLQVGLLSNVGTGLIYARHARALDLLASLVERQGSRLRRAASD
jgi:cation transport ATPase